jgi:predicted glutamine amidotransferase
MCIAILNKKEATLKRELLKNCWDNNGDGAGLLYIDNKKQMKTFKELKSFEVFYQEYSRVKKSYGKRNIVIHFRISTHGKIDETNCHPFLVNDNLGFVHNGMIYDVPTSKDYSDTYMFNEVVLKNFTEGFEYNEIILDMLEGFIGSSKLVFLNSNNEYAIVNEKAGHWANGCWFSNGSYKYVSNYVDYGGTKVYRGSLGSGIGYTPGNVYGQSYGSSYAWSEPSTKKQKDIEREEIGGEICYDCGMLLYDENEKEFNTCTYCQVEYYNELQKDDECESCLGIGAKYNEEWKAMICATCDAVPF